MATRTAKQIPAMQRAIDTPKSLARKGRIAGVINRFVESTANKLGVGKLRDVRGSVAVVEYLESPASAERIQVTVPTSSLRIVRLDPEVRVYFEDSETFRWQVGRILHFQESDGQYLVRFPNEERRLIDETELFTRWSKPIDEPTDHLALQLNETPFWHSGRSIFLHSVYSQRNACGGMPGLLSSAIELVEHQVNVVRRVLQDPFQRYLLADEVGLGKTIEAGVLIRQHVLDEPDSHRVLVIVPNALIRQWKEELTCRFHLEDQLGATIHVVGYRDVGVIARFGSAATLLVIDEAHHVSAWAYSHDAELSRIYRSVERIAADPQRRVLLLSATPVLHNERTFLAMLHLIDPVLYSLEDLEAFRSRVRHRQEVAEGMMSLTDDESNFFLAQTLETLGEFFPKEDRFYELAKPIAELIERDVSDNNTERRRLIRALRTYVSETWRLHRRLLRSRRGEQTEFLLPGRKGVEVVHWNSRDQRIVEDVLSEWRLAAAEANVGDSGELNELARVLTEAGICDPEALAVMIDYRLGRRRGVCDELSLFDAEHRCLEGTPRFDGESQILQRLYQIAKRWQCETKLAEIEDLVARVDTAAPNQPTATVIFCNYPTTADRLCKCLQQRFGPQRVLRHSPDTVQWTRFIHASDSLVLVCDRRAEEGLNLQNRQSVVVHFDLPLSANRIEQRMGRLDRFGTGRPIKSFALVARDSDIQREWTLCLNEAMGVFNRSIASLQYLIEAQFQQVWTDYLDAGADAITEATERLGGKAGEIEKEMRRIHAQDELDAMDYASAEDTEFFNNLVTFDLKSAEFRQSLDQWLVERLHFRCFGETGRTDDVVRYQFCRRDDLRPRRGERDTLMPYGEFLRRFGPALDELDEYVRPVVAETKRMTFDRQSAQIHETRLGRIGDPLIDATERYLRWDDRGVCSAMWRYRPKLRSEEPIQLAFRFDLVIEANPAPISALLDEWPEVSLAALRRRADMAFPPITRRFWLDSELERITDPNLLKLLAERYRDELIRGRPQEGKDFNINQTRWKKVNQVFDVTVWRGLCYEARRRAEDILRETTQLPDRIRDMTANAETVSADRIEQFESRLARIDGEEAAALHHELEFERAFADALRAAIQQPAIRVDSIGAVFLSNQNPFAEEVEKEDED
jgi:ATP-dependent helicase HepA